MIEASRLGLERDTQPTPNGAPVSPRPFMGDDTGVAAVEFALILPIMLMVYLGLVELSRSMRAAQRIDLIAHALADLTAQQLTGGAASGQAGLMENSNPDISPEKNIQTIFAAGMALLNSTSAEKLKLKMTITEVNITSPTPTTWQARATWTVTKNSGTPRPNVQTASNAAPITSGSMPTSYTQVTNGVNPVTGPVIVADVSYVYSSGMNYTFQFLNWFGWNSLSTITLNRTSYSPVRNTYTPPHIQYYMTSGTNHQAPAL